MGGGIRIIEGEYEQRAGYKRYSVVGNGPDSVLEAYLPGTGDTVMLSAVPPE